MVLAQYVKTKQFASEDYLIFKIKRRRGQFVILDNGTPEGELQGNNSLMEAYRIVQPDELVLPDVWEDRSATVRAVIQFVEEYGDEVPPIKRMVVPQGLSMSGWKACLQELVSEVSFTTIGVPKHLDGKEGGGRVEAVRWIEQMGWHNHYHVHLLGCYQDPVREVREIMAIAPWVRGIDTAAPFAYAQEKKDITVGYHISYEWGAPFDEETASWNIDAMLRACSGG
jgi:hypothetical protein